MSAKVGADDYIEATSATAAEFEALPREAVGSPDPGQARPREGTHAQVLVDLACEARVELFHAADGDTGYAVIPVADHLETWAIRSKGFRRWFARCFYHAMGKPPSAQPMNDAIALLEAKAQFDGRAAPVFTRVGRQGEAIYLDLGNEHWEAVAVTTAGWQVVRRPPVRFRRPRGLMPLPTPVRGGRLSELRPFLNLGDDADWMLVVGWLLAALRPVGPYPVLVLHGEQGSGKSTLARALRTLIDPNTAALRGDPLDQRNLMIAATNAWMLCCDNLSHVPAWLSDGFCRLATGGGFSTRELYSDQDEMLFDVQRPVILNGIEELVTRADLLDRALMIYLPAIPEAGRRDERRFWRDFDRAGPRVLGALLDVVTAALREEPHVRLTALPRLADFGVWVTAAERALEWKPGAFLRVYQYNRAAAVGLALDASPVAPLVRGLADQGAWEGTASELLAELGALADETTRKARTWPASPQRLSNVLRRLAPALREVDVAVTFTRRPRTGDRLVGIQKIDPVDRHQRHQRHHPLNDAGMGGDDTPSGVTEAPARSSPRIAATGAAGDNGDASDDASPRCSRAPGEDGAPHSETCECPACLPAGQEARAPW